MYQKRNEEQDDELDLSGEPPVIEIDDSDEPTPVPAKARPASTRASSAAAQRARAKERARTKSSASSSKNPYRTRSAAEIRAEREARKKRSLTELSDDPRDRRRAAEIVSVLPMEKVMELLHHPTRFVSEDELRREYAYVIADLRSMGLLSLGLVLLLFLLAQFLPR